MNTLFFYFQQLLLKLKSYLPDKDNLDWLDGFAFIISSWLIIFPYPSYTGLFCILAFIPVLGITLTVLKGNAHFDHYIKKAFNKDGVEQNIVSAYILTSTLTIALSAYLNFECENYYSLLTHGAIAFTIFAIIFIFTHRNIRGSLKHQAGVYVLLGFCILFYSYGITYGVNCLFDSSKPERFETKIIGKYISHHRKSPDTYYVTITPWGHHHDSENIKVSSDLYDRLNEGDLVDIDLQQGLFDIPWYHIEDSNNISNEW
jgi:hypothetical protein